MVHPKPSNKWWCAAAVGVFYVSTPVYADFPGATYLLNSGPVPANGVLKFSAGLSGVTVRIIAQGGDEVPGQFVAEGVWRPEQPFAVGRYTADLTFEANPEFAVDGEFEVVPALEPNTDFIDIRISSHVRSGDVLTQVCCQAGAADVDLQPCTSACEPRCIPLSYAAVHMVDVYYASDSDSLFADQTIIRIPAAFDEGKFVQGVWPVEGEPENLCGVAEVFSWLDDSVTLMEECIPNPKPKLDPIAETVTSFGRISECSIPPAGYEAQWCSAQAYTCTKEVETLDGYEQAVVIGACTEYYDLCGASPPRPSEDGSGTSDPNTPDPSNEGGCECTLLPVQPSRDMPIGLVWGATALVLGGVWRRSARRACGNTLKERSRMA